jgi:ATP-dependent Clp protease adaptor protein ClpS
MPEKDRQEERREGVGLKERKERKEQHTQRPRKYRVIILNDDFTPIDFVVQLVATVFRKTPEEAAQITLKVHQAGSAVVGVYTHEIAETKVVLSMAYAQKYEHPLQVMMEPEE